MRYAGLIIGAIIAVCACWPALAQAQTSNVSILYTGDTHGHLRNFYYDSGSLKGGVAKRAIYFQEKRRHQSMAWLTLDTGDALSGTALSNVFKGFLDVEAMNRLKYDAMVLGVHDFDYGVAVLKQRMSEAEFPFLAANVIDSTTGQPFGTPYVIIERNGVKMAVLGLTTGDLAELVSPENFSGLSVRDPLEVARELLPEIMPKADVIVALTHLGIYEDIRLSAQFQEIDVIVGGKSHSALSAPMSVGRCMIVHGVPYGLSVGLLKLSYNPADGDFDRVWWDGKLVAMDGTIVPNSHYQEWLDEQQAEMFNRLNVIVGESAMPLSSIKVRSSETALGNFVADVLRQQTGAHAAIIPAGFLHGDIAEGPLTLGDLYKTLPLEHYASVLTVSGGELKEIIRDGAAQIGRPGFMQVSGLNIGIGFGGSVEVMLNGQPVDDFAQYRLATTDYLADGNLGYVTLGKVSARSETGRRVRDYVVEHLGSGQAAQGLKGDRIRFLARNAGGSLPTSPPPATERPVEEPADRGLDSPGGADIGGSRPEQPDSSGEFAGDRLDRTGEPLDEPITVEDEVITDTASEVTPIEEQPVPPPSDPPAQPPAFTEPDPDSTPLERMLAEATTEVTGLNYRFAIYLTQGGDYRFLMEIVNNGNQPIEISYATSERFNFQAFEGTNLLWHFNHNRFFVQSTQSETLGAGERRLFDELVEGENLLSLIGRQVRFEAKHSRSDSPVSIPLEITLGR